MKIQSLIVDITVSAALIWLSPSSDNILHRVEDAALNIFLAEYVKNLLSKEDQS
jgi:hypothetical protein